MRAQRVGRVSRRLGWAVVVLLAAAPGGCDGGDEGPDATISPRLTRVAAIQIVSGTPLVRGGDGTLDRACALGPGDVLGGLELDVVLEGTYPRLECAGADDADWSIRPGDEVERVVVAPGESISADSFALAVDCVEPYPDRDRLTTRACDGLRAPRFTLANVAYRALTEDGPARCEPVAVVLLIDQSGSMKGFVDGSAEYREAAPGTFPFPADDERIRAATDPNSVRLSAAQDFIGLLNANDELLVLSFNEAEDGANIQALCSESPLPAEGTLAGEPEWVRQGLPCFGTDHEPVRTAVSQAFGRERGRTPLWEAVRAAYEFLSRPDVAAAAVRHVVVISDGPDTCNAESAEGVAAGAADSQCSSVSYAAAQAVVTQGNAAPGAVPVHVHFVQLQARAYPERDPRMMALACETGGLYQFINAADFPDDTSGAPGYELGRALSEALARVRRALAGRWVLRARGPVDWDVEPGTVAAVSGTLTLLAGEHAPQDTTQPFDVSGDDAVGPWDLRVAVHRACSPGAACETGAGEDGTCCEGLCREDAGACP